MTATETAPRVTAELLRRVAEHPDSVVVWLPAVGLCDVAETGLTEAQAENPAIVPVLWASDAEAALAQAAGHHATAARQATAQLADLHARGLL